MQIDRETGLILECGGMRGVFTSGVLDAFMK
ncbi:MAG: patatin family protein, partial [Prevotella histicola]